MSQRFYVHDGTRERGPFSSTELVDQSRTGVLSITHRIRRDDSQQWIAASKVRGLAFPNNVEDSRLISALNTLASRVVNVLDRSVENPALRQHVARQIEQHCCDMELVSLIERGDEVDLHSTVPIMVGHDLAYLSITTILADGKVDPDEIATVSGLLQLIGNAFAEKYTSYQHFRSATVEGIERFLAKFKKDRPHYAWPTASRPSALSTDVMIGSFAAMAADLCDPSSNCLAYYCQLVRATVDCILGIGGVTPEELAFKARVEKYLDDLSALFTELRQPQIPQSPLLDGPSVTESRSAARRDSQHTHFRKVSWGMTREEVMASEEAPPYFETSNSLFFESSVAGLKAKAIYVFSQGICVRAKYSVCENHSNLNDHISDFDKLVKLLDKKYGPARHPDYATDGAYWKNDLYQGDYDEWGFAVSIGHLVLMSEWSTDESEIAMILTGDNYEVIHAVEYSSKTLAHLEEDENERNHLGEL